MTRQEPTPVISPNELPALFWLAKELRLHPDELGKVFASLRNGTSLYRTRKLPKRSGGYRTLWIPNASLKHIQRRINRYILEFLHVEPNVHGFSGGSIGDAIRPHLNSRCILCVDLVEAFPRVCFDDVLQYFTNGRQTWWAWDRIVIEERGWFSWYAAHALAELVTVDNQLPQGAPTSPRLFDLLCTPLDRALNELARKSGGKYTRYADNIFFSLPAEEFPSLLRKDILKKIEGRKREGPRWRWHKLRIVRLDRRAVRVLGLNIVDGKVHNTRPFKRRLHIAIHHVGWLLANGEDWTDAWAKLKGQMAFAQKESLSPNIMQSYGDLEQRISSLPT